MEHAKYSYFKYIPERFKTERMCTEAFKNSKTNISHIPPQFIREDMVMESLLEVALLKTHELLHYKVNNFDKNFLTNVFTEGSELNKKLSNKIKAMILYCYPEMRSSCTEINVLKRAWDIQVNMATIGFEDEFKTEKYLPGPKIAVEMFLNDDDIDVIDKYAHIESEFHMTKKFMENVSSQLKKEIQVYIDGGEKALKEYYEKIADETNYIYTNKGKILSDDLIEMILNGEHVDVLDDELTVKYIEDYETERNYVFIKLLDQDGCIMEYDDSGRIIDAFAFEESDLEVYMTYSVREEGPDFKPQFIFDAVHVAKLFDEDLVFTNYKITESENYDSAEIYFSCRGNGFKYTFNYFNDTIYNESFEKATPYSETDIDITDLYEGCNFVLGSFAEKFNEWNERQLQENITK